MSSRRQGKRRTQRELQCQSQRRRHQVVLERRGYVTTVAKRGTYDRTVPRGRRHLWESRPELRRAWERRQQDESYLSKTPVITVDVTGAEQAGEPIQLRCQVDTEAEVNVVGSAWVPMLWSRGHPTGPVGHRMGLGRDLYGDSLAGGVTAGDRNQASTRGEILGSAGPY